MNVQYNIKAITYFKKSNCLFYSSSKSVFSNRGSLKNLELHSFLLQQEEQNFAKALKKN